VNEKKCGRKEKRREREGRGKKEETINKYSHRVSKKKKAHGFHHAPIVVSLKYSHLGVWREG
jgi:hypothetical protein